MDLTDACQKSLLKLVDGIQDHCEVQKLETGIQLKLIARLFAISQRIQIFRRLVELT